MEGGGHCAEKRVDLTGQHLDGGALLRRVATHRFGEFFLDALARDLLPGRPGERVEEAAFGNAGATQLLQMEKPVQLPREADDDLNSLRSGKKLPRHVEGVIQVLRHDRIKK
jgi:hypothetical protein